MSLGDRTPVLVCGVGLGTLMYTCALSTTERAERRRAAWRGWLEAGVARACSLVLDRGDAESARLRALERRLEAVEGRVRQRQLTPHERQKLRLWVDGLEAELEAKERRLGSAAGRGRVRKPASSSSHSGAGAAWSRLRNWVGVAEGGAVRLQQRLSSTRDALRLAEEEQPPLPGSDDDDTGYPAPQAASAAAGMAGALVGMQAVASGAGGTSTASGPLAYEPEAVDSRLLLPLPHHDPSSWAEDKERLQAMMFADGDGGGGWGSDGGGAHRSAGRGRSSSSSRRRGGGGGGGGVLECFSALFLGEEEQPVALGQVLADHGDELPPTILCAMAALALRVDPAADDSLFASSAVAAEEAAVVGSQTRRRQQAGRGAATTTRGAPAPPRGSSPRPSPPPHVLAAAPHCEALRLSAEQVGCLLANEFFGTLPHHAHLPPPSLCGAGPLPLRALITAEAPHGYAACACLLHYFESLIVLTSSSSSSSSSAYITYRAKLPLRQLTHVRDKIKHGSDDCGALCL
eukprot:COSAG01_NODE_7771_length_3064_cov_40.195616_1_plen_518_part_00